jgi:NAD+ synthase
MVTLYYFANKLDYLVVGTSNKSEYKVGYFTKYGDGAVDLMPLADIYKTEIIKLAEYINVPSKILNKPPSADLWKGQTDEEELGITYKELDKILKNYEKKEISTDTPQNKIVEKMIRKSMHKRLFPPIFKRKI